MRRLQGAHAAQHRAHRTVLSQQPFTDDEALGRVSKKPTNPEEFYPLDAGGQPLKFNDLPPEYQANVNTTEVPYNRHPGDIPALSDGDMEDVIAFLNTLTDGFQN